MSSALAQLTPRAFLKAGLLAVALGAAVLVIVVAPSLVRAQEPPQISPQYYQDLEAHASSPEAGRDTSVPIAPEELGLDPRGEGGASPSAPASLFLQSTGEQTSTYDFAIDLVSINGNIPTVPGCDRNPLGVPRSFFDNFDDGLLEEGCTSHLQKLGTFIESGGLLRMLSENGIRAGGGITLASHTKPPSKTARGASSPSLVFARTFPSSRPYSPPTPSTSLMPQRRRPSLPHLSFPT